MEKHLILLAHHENWGLIGPGSWRGVTWRIFSDGSYTLESEFIPDGGSDGPVRYRGKMRAPSFRKLTEAISCDWDSDLHHVEGCDGDAWAIDQYGENGVVIRSSGPLDYIYGKEKVERIAELLPRRDSAYHKPPARGPWQAAEEGYRVEQRIRKIGDLTRCSVKQSFTLIPFAMDTEREQFIIFMLPRKEELSVFLWVYIREEDDEEKRIRITAVNALMQYTKWTEEAMDVSGEYPDEIIGKALSFLAARPKSRLWSAFDEMEKDMDRIGGAQRWKPIEARILTFAENARAHSNGLMYMY